MDNQKIVFEKLLFGTFPSNLATILYSSRMQTGDVIYVSGNYKVQEPNYTLPGDRRDHFEHDVIMILAHCGERTYGERTRRKIVNKDILSIEIKTTQGDLLKKDVCQYLGATRLFFIAVPKELLKPVIDKYRRHPRKEVIGIIDSDRGQIVVMPQFQDFSKARRDRLLSQSHTSEHRYPFCNPDVELHGIHRVMDNGLTKPVFLDFEGLKVNTEYLSYYKN